LPCQYRIKEEPLILWVFPTGMAPQFVAARYIYPAKITATPKQKV
jgi:hypothetical protein